jgi:hypothetical protein
MSKGKRRHIFPTWRTHWAELDGISPLLERTDLQLVRRSLGNRRMPKWVGSSKPQDFDIALAGLRAWANGDLPEDLTARPNIVRRIHDSIWPIMEMVVWPRWLYLERAFFDSSETGDLLFAALVLRTMCEELQRLLSVDLTADAAAVLAASQHNDDQAQLQAFISVAWTFLDGIPFEIVRMGDDRFKPKFIAKYLPRIEKARSALNSYVHPNYGSHIAALYPESATAARLILEAVEAIYEGFFTLSWAEKPAEFPTRPLGIGPLCTWPKAARRVQSVTLPELRRRYCEPEIVDLMRASAFTAWMNEERADIDRLLTEPDLAELFDDLPKTQGARSTPSGPSGFALWDGARSKNIIDFAIARRTEQQLSREFPTGAPVPDQQVDWLKFNSISLKLAVALDRVKSGTFKSQIVRQIAQGNSIASWICLRSLIEHNALITWLPQQVGESLDDLASAAEAGKGLPERASVLQQSLANFLAGQAKGTQEIQRAWVLKQEGGIRVAWLRLENVVASAFAQNEGFLLTYDLGSGVLHGRKCRGLELMLSETSLRMSADLASLRVLERLCDPTADVGPLALAIFKSVQLEHAANLGGTLNARNDAEAGQILGNLSARLVRGTDYTGDGTFESPFVILEHLQFYSASYALLKQLGVDPEATSRTLAYDNEARLCDRWTSDKCEYWFLTTYHARGEA